MLKYSGGRHRSKIVSTVFIGIAVATSLACGSGDDPPTSPAGATSTVGASITARPTSTRQPGQPGSPVASVRPGTTTTPGQANTPTAQNSPVLTFGRELLEDGSFEKTAFEHWEPRLQSGQLIEISTTESLTGSKSLHMTAPPSEENWARVNLRERIPAQGGTSIRLAYSAMQVNGGWAELLLDFYNGDGVFVTRSVAGRSDASAGEWLEHAAIFDIEPGIATAQLIIRLQTQPIAGQQAQPSSGVPEIFVDDVSVKQILE